MKIVGFKYSHTIYIVIIDEGIHTNTTNLNDTQTLLRQNYEAAVASCSDASTANTQAVRDKGFGFVEMATDAEAQAATQAMNGQTIDGRQIKVNEAKPKTGGGGGGGGRSGGGGGYGGGGGGGRGGYGGGGGGRGGGGGGYGGGGGDYGGGSGGGVDIGGDYDGDGGDGSDGSDEDTYSGGDDRTDGGGDVGACSL